MKLGSIWSTADRTQFKVTDIKTIDDKKWIYYTNVKTEQHYSCLEEAFKNRFKEIVNNG